MKKKILGLAIALLLCFTGVGLFACNEGSPTTDVYNDLTTLVTQINSNTQIFQGGAQNESGSNFQLKLLTSGHGYMNNLFIIPMKYVNKNYTVLAPKTKSANLTKDVTNMKNAYAQLCRQYEDLLIFDPSEDAYKGAFVDFLSTTTTFISATYDVALDIADFEEKQGVYQDFATQGVSAEEALKVKNYLSLKIGKDYFNLLLKSSNTNDFSKSYDSSEYRQFKLFFDTTKSQLSSFFTSFVSSTNVNTFTAERTEIMQLLDGQEVMDEERDNLNLALKKVNMFELYRTYECDIKEYAKDVKNAEQYYNEITNYYSIYLVKMQNFIKGILIK